MIKLIRLDPSSESYIFNKSKNEKVCKLDYNNHDLMIHIEEDGNCFDYPIENVCKQYNSLYYISMDQDKILLDDGYYDSLIRAGYLVLGNYDKIRLEKEEGLSILKQIQDNVSYGIIKMVDNYLPDNMYLKSSSNTNIVIESQYYQYSIYIEPIMTVISENQKRKLNDLPYYPYNKDMDKYGTLYVRAFAKLSEKYTEKEATEAGISKYTELNDLIRGLIVSINSLEPKNNYHYEPVEVKKMIIQ